MPTRPRRALIPLSADPITYGHLHLIREAAKECDEAVVLIANNERKLKTYIFDNEERVAIAQRAVAEAGIGNARVLGSGGLIVDVYLRENCDVVYRGTRNAQDKDYEEELAEVNAIALPSLRWGFRYIQAPQELKHVSSSMVKEFVRHYLDVDMLVPVFIKQWLEERLLNQYRVALVGGLAVGKSHIAKLLVQYARKWAAASHLNVDELLRRLYQEDSPGAQEIRDQLAEMFGPEVLTADRKGVVRPRLGQFIFASDAKQAYDDVISLTKPHVHRLYRADLKGREGLVVVEWAQLAEMGMSGWTNHNVVVVDSPDRQKLVAAREITPSDFADRAKYQLTADQKVELLQAVAVKANSGRVLRFDNCLDKDAEAEVNDLFWEVIKLFHEKKLITKSGA